MASETLTNWASRGASEAAHTIVIMDATGQTDYLKELEEAQRIYEPYLDAVAVAEIAELSGVSQHPLVNTAMYPVALTIRTTV